LHCALTPISSTSMETGVKVSEKSIPEGTESVHVDFVKKELSAAHTKITRRRQMQSKDMIQHELETIRAATFQGQPGKHQPWMSDDGLPVWSTLRIRLAKIVLTAEFESFMAMIIVLNLVLMIYESDQDAKCYPDYSNKVNECPFSSNKVAWLNTCNWILLAIYTVELLLRLYIEQLNFFRKGWNILDFAIVVLSWASEFLDGYPSLSFLRVLRLTRLLRAARVLVSIPELYLLISGLASSLRTIFFGMCMLLLGLILCAVLVVQVIHPVNSLIDYGLCERCGRAFSSVSHAALTLFQQIVAGDSWGSISVPIIEEDPAIGWILLVVCVSISLGMMNLILAVIVDRAAEARDNDRKAKVKMKDKARSANMLELARLCSRMDKDDSGCLSLKEMLNGYQDPDFNDLMNIMDIEPNDLQIMFEALDENGDGEVKYKDMCLFLHQSQSRSPETVMSILRIEVEAMKRYQRNKYAFFEKELTKQSSMLEKLSEQLAALPLSSDHAPEPPPSTAPRLLGDSAVAEPMRSALCEQTELRLPEDFGDDLLQKLQDIQKNTEQLSSAKGDLIKQTEGQVLASLDTFASTLKQTLIEKREQLSNTPISQKLDDLQVARIPQNFLGPVLQELGQDLSQEASVLVCAGRLLGSVGKFVEKDLYCGQRGKEDVQQSAGHENGRFNI